MIFDLDRKPAHHPALVDADGSVLTYGELASRTARGADLLRAAGRRLVFLLTSQTSAAVVAYLACLEAGFPVCLVEGGGELPERLRLAYQPDLILHGALPETIEQAPPAGDLHPDLALLLTTSGSTGSPKLVRLTRRNVEANAASIAEYLEISPDERAVASLPVSYSYGLSVLNSHLLAGACIVLTSASFLKPEFWAAFREHACTSFAGVPFMYETLARLRFDPAKYPPLRTMTQAGGRLKPELVETFRVKCAAAGVKFVVMYGQTEATARISWMPPEWLESKPGGVGRAIPGGRLRLEPVPDAPDLSEIVYTGPNVMMGYAADRAELAAGDELHGTLRTGDLGRMDADGCCFVTGRLKRFAKLFGSRVSLDDVEHQAEAAWPVRAAATDRDGTLVVFVVPREPVDVAAIRSGIAAALTIPPSAVEVRVIDDLPLTSSGKKDYRALPA